MSVLPEPTETSTRSGVAAIVGVPLVCRALVPVSPSCATAPCIHGDPKERASQTAESTAGRLAAAEDLSVADNDEESPVPLLIM
jgi:hypothetical protein